jgi:predicted DNA-binding protein (UPF0251 family)
MKQEEVAEHLGVSRRYVRDRLDAFREAAQKMIVSPKAEAAT